MKRRTNRALTQRYDLNMLRAIQKLEDQFRVELSAIYDCDPDDIPVDIDTLAVFNLAADQREAFLVGLNGVISTRLLFLSSWTCLKGLRRIQKP